MAELGGLAGASAGGATNDRASRPSSFDPPAAGPSSANQFQVLDAYVGLMFSDWQVSFGRQSLLWGPGDGGALILSDNAAPLNMFRINRTTPVQVAQCFGVVGTDASGILSGPVERPAVHERQWHRSAALSTRSTPSR